MGSKYARIAKLERLLRPAPVAVPIPHCLIVEADETPDEARRRFRREWPNAPRHHALLIVPRKVRTDEERADFVVRFKAQQLRLIGMGKAVRPMKEIGNG